MSIFDKRISNVNDYVLETIDLHRTYMLGKVEVNALRGIDFKVKRGELVLILGPSGSGKSTLLNQIGALDKPTSGEVIIDGKRLSEMGKSELAVIRREVGFVFQFFNLIGRFTALQNVELSMSIQGISKKERRKRAKKILEEVGLGERIHHTPTELSGGEQQRVSLARALAQDPEYLLMDEPTGNIDTKTRDKLIDLIQNLNKEHGITMIIVTHDPFLAKIADRVEYLVDGKIRDKEESEKITGLVPHTLENINDSNATNKKVEDEEK
jgi:putative ABC transport system ATP-binding protein